MINLLLGAPGGGKSYEACVYHIMAALEKGRKVITNLPLELEKWNAIVDRADTLIEIRTRTLATDPNEAIADEKDDERSSLSKLLRSAKAARFSSRAFANPEDYSDEWRHPELKFGPLYVIDEAHFAVPKGGTPRAVSEWYSMHRHFNVDVLLITQTYGKVDPDIVGLVQMVYRVRKNVALGAPKSYTRKVQDGVRGEVVNTSIRMYQRKYFGLYRSHTQGQSVDEFNATDVKPLWQHWTFIGAAICLSMVVILVVSGTTKVNPIGVGVKAQAPKAPASGVQLAAAPKVAALGVSGPASAPAKPASGASGGAIKLGEAQELVGPYSRFTLHIVGVLRQPGKADLWSFVLAANGQGIATINSDDLRRAGYKLRPLHDCAAEVSYGDSKLVRDIVCDAPSVTYALPSLRTRQGG